MVDNDSCAMGGARLLSLHLVSRELETHVGFDSRGAIIVELDCLVGWALPESIVASALDNCYLVDIH